ncbi:MULTISPECIES: hypothetical protein [Stenotrophomonas]|jgi:hypothetical protein|uniref:hypothetical protein n=1 Tax=Stenotrophomonas TaxID=40323 RepID=UPI0016589246|nr:MULTISPECIES: hypothetical protein [Stenotrophomonas]MBC9081061.1 hypothetical protein [Stenotrophomonas maltophilia]MBC9092324.1 hypothetical protein [Stenotrophomonas maltophilia]MBH1519123.1 hypothetical protein [Stenotrophomonas maltophilia]MCF3466269.1 hypothetical protein [Stenotrophomonas maltophilia]MCF3484214.1 hypothetical protein [Stenotrophomonas maltophilia]
MSKHPRRLITAAGSRATFILATAALLAACGGPTDKKMVTNGTQQQYRESIDAIDAELSDHERAAFNWAVAGMNLEKLNQAYPNASVRQVVRGQVKHIRDANPKEIGALRKEVTDQLPTVAELQKVTAVDTVFLMEDSFFGPKPVITARIVNRSTLPLSEASWNAALYINGDAQPVATSKVRSDFRSIEGLKPDHHVTARFTVGFVKGDHAWTTLAIRQAASTRVELEMIPETALDYGDKAYLSANNQERIDSLERQLKQADEFEDI